MSYPSIDRYDILDVIVRQYGGTLHGGINWSWAHFTDEIRGRAAFTTIQKRFPEMDHRGYYNGSDNHVGGFRYRF